MSRKSAAINVTFGVIVSTLCIFSMTVVAPIAATAAGIDRSDLLIIFLHEQSVRARIELSGGTRQGAINRAARIHVNPTDIPVLDQAALLFADQESRLREEARAYHREAIAAKRNQAADMVRTFTQRRAELALAAFATIKARVSPASYQRLNHYLDSDFQASLSIAIPVSH